LKRTVTLSAPSTTCAFVTMLPSSSTTKPEPVAVPSCGTPNGDSPLLVTPWAEMNTTPRPSSL
jgi:hypothetical protein